MSARGRWFLAPVAAVVCYFRANFRDLGDGVRILCSRRFWRAFRDYWSGDAISARLDEFTARLREQTHQEPDRDVERRRALRRVVKKP